MRPTGRGSSKAKSRRPAAPQVNNGLKRKQNQRDSPPRYANESRGPHRNGGSHHYNDGYDNHRDDGYNNRRDDGYNNRRDDGYNNRRDDGYNNRRDDGYDARGSGYSFKGAANHQGPSHHDSFTFRAGPTAPSFPQYEGNFERRDQRAPRNRGGRSNASNGHQHGRRPFNNRSFVPAHARTIFQQTRRSPTPEQLEGMNSIENTTFKDVEQLTDGRDDETTATNKRVKLDGSMEQTVKPKWSNPDPYTVMPPPGATGRMDLVQAIRKAKVEASSSANNIATQHEEDFIAFDAVTSADVEHFISMGPPTNAPTGPKALSKSQASPISKVSTMSDEAVDYDHNLEDGEIYDSLITLSEVASLPDEAGARASSRKEKDRKKRKRQDLDVESSKVDVPPQDSPAPSPRTPWFTAHADGRPDSKLSIEIRQFYEYVRPTEQDRLGRLALVERVKNVLQTCEIYRYCKPQLHAFGSFATGLYLPNADMDLVALSTRFLETGRPYLCTEPKQINALAKYLRKSNIARPGSVAAITKSRVPLIKWVDGATGIRVDLSFENESGLHAILTTRKWIQDFPSMPAIVAIIKRMLDVASMNDVHTGGLGGFAIICLVISLSQSIPGARSDNPYYDDLLLRFLHFYGKDFKLGVTGIDMSNFQRFRKADRDIFKPDRLTLMDPNKPDHDVTGGSFNVVAIFHFLRRMLTALNNRLEQHGRVNDVRESILGAILAGDYATFRLTRQRLQQSLDGLGKQPAELLPLPNSVLNRHASAQY